VGNTTIKMSGGEEECRGGGRGGGAEQTNAKALHPQDTKVGVSFEGRETAGPGRRVVGEGQERGGAAGFRSGNVRSGVRAHSGRGVAREKRCGKRLEHNGGNGRESVISRQKGRQRINGTL